MRCVITPENGAYTQLEGFHVLEALYVGLRGLHHGAFRSKVSIRVVHILLGNRIGLKQILITRRGDFRQADVGLGRGEFGAGLRELLIYFGSIDFGKQFALALDAELPISLYHFFR